MKQYYELHITMQEPAARREQVRANVEYAGWTFSAIDGDPVLGAGVKMYATKHINERVEVADVLNELDRTTSDLVAMGATVIRKKIELVLHDARKGRDF